MIQFRLAALAGALALPLALGACGGGGAENKTDVKTTTTGQELMDLKQAYDQGAMTKEEYEKERERILDSN